MSQVTIELQIRTILQELTALKEEVKSPALKRMIELQMYALSAIQNVAEETFKKARE